MPWLSKRFVALVLLLGVATWHVPPSQSVTLPLAYPRLANYYLNPSMTVTQAAELAKWDIVVIGLEQQYVNPAVFSVMREKNPDIIILAYVLSEEFPGQYLTMTDVHHPTKKILDGIDDSWWLRTSGGQQTGFWPGANMLNVTNNVPEVNGFRWNTFLPQFMHDHVMSTGLWDGIYYDNVFQDVSWVNGGDIDLDRNGQRDVAATADSAWREGMLTMLTRSRQLEGNSKVILGNGGGQYYPQMNGRLIEEFPSSLDGGWSGAMAKYADVMSRGLFPSLVIINRMGSGQADYQAMRYGLTSTLLQGGFFSFDEGSVRHAALWRYDEYNTNLGLPLGPAKRIWPSTSTSFAEGVWRRDFERGVVIVNATSSSRTVALGEGLEELRGTQSSVNGGKIIDSLKLTGRDGRILLKRNIIPADATFSNGSVLQVFSETGQKTRSGFFSYDSRFSGGATMVVGDANDDGKTESIVADQGRLRVVNDRGQTTASWYPFGTGYRSNMSIALARLTAGGERRILVGPRNGKNQRVKVYSLNGKLLFSFAPFTRDIPGGVFVAAGDINADGRDELVVGSGQGVAPLVRVYDQKGTPVRQWYAYGKGFRGGVRVAAGDLTGDGRAEIVTGAGPGGGPHVRVVNSRGQNVTKGFFALPSSYRQGIFVAVDDIDQHGINRILVSTPTVY